MRPQEPSAFCCDFNHANERETAISHSGVPPFSLNFSKRLCIEHLPPKRCGSLAVWAGGPFPPIPLTIKALTIFPPCPASGSTMASPSGSETSLGPSTPIRVCGGRFAMAFRRLAPHLHLISLPAWACPAGMKSTAGFAICLPTMITPASSSSPTCTAMLSINELPPICRQKRSHVDSLV